MFSQKEAEGAVDRAIYWAKDPYHWIEDGAIYTLDQTDYQNPIKQYPKEPWIKELTALWLDHPLFACPKSRRMKITWWAVINHLWLAMFRQGQAIYFQSDKEEKSDELVRRAEFIYDHLPLPDAVKPKKKAKYCRLEFPELHSFIQGVPQGATQLRQFTSSAIMLDEFAFWMTAKESFYATKPTIDGGGRITIVSSAQDGFYRDLCMDSIF